MSSAGRAHRRCHEKECREIGKLSATVCPSPSAPRARVHCGAAEHPFHISCHQDDDVDLKFMIEDLVVGRSAHAIPCIGRRSCRRTTVAVQPAFGIFWKLRRRLAPLRVRVHVRDRRPPLLRLLPLRGRTSLTYGIRVLRPLPSILLLLFLLTLLATGLLDGIIKVCRVSPPSTGAVRAHGC